MIVELAKRAQVRAYIASFALQIKQKTLLDEAHPRTPKIKLSQKSLPEAKQSNNSVSQNERKQHHRRTHLARSD
jgi:hypothetical protein